MPYSDKFWADKWLTERDQARAEALQLRRFISERVVSGVRDIQTLAAEGHDIDPDVDSLLAAAELALSVDASTVPAVPANLDTHLACSTCMHSPLNHPVSPHEGACCGSIEVCDCPRTRQEAGDPDWGVVAVSVEEARS